MALTLGELLGMMDYGTNVMINYMTRRGEQTLETDVGDFPWRSRFLLTRTVAKLEGTLNYEFIGEKSFPKATIIITIAGGRKHGKADGSEAGDGDHRREPVEDASADDADASD